MKNIIKTKNIQAKNCMTKSKLTDYVINPYLGCQHGCIYCYADFMKKFNNINEDWGDFVYIKKNCPKILEKEIEKNKSGHVWLSSVCDCYQPIEAKEKLTRKILEILLKKKEKFTLEILTKSSLVERDFDLMKKFSKKLELGMSINSLNKDISRLLEPLASSPENRLKTLKKAKNEGIEIFGFISPVFPFTNLEKLFLELKKTGVSYVWIEILNHRKHTREKVLKIIKKNLPNKYLELDNFFSNYYSYCKKIKKEAKRLEIKYNLKIKDIVVH